MATRDPRWRKTWQYLSGLPDRMRTRRWHRVLLLSALTGVITGLAIAGFDWLTARTILERVFKLPRLAQAFAPGVGLVLAWAALRWLGNNARPSTSEEYLHAYHDPEHPLDPRPFPARVLASIATLGFGGAMGFEGPSIYMGAGIGSFLERRFGRYLTQDDLRLLLVAGAAAGVSAIFKAPATGAIFAIEVPYQEDTAAHALLPALIGSATSYLTYVAFYGTTPLFEISGQPHFDATRLLGALGIGILAGLGARGFALALRSAKAHSRQTSARWRLLIGGLGLATVTGLCFVLFNDGLTLGPGYRAITWTLNPNRTVALIAALFLLHALATVLTVEGGGAGGLFIPLFVQGSAPRTLRPRRRRHPHQPVPRHRRRRVPRRRLPHPHRRNRLRRRSHRPPRLHRPRPHRHRHRPSPHGQLLRHRLPAHPPTTAPKRARQLMIPALRREHAKRN